MSVFTEITEDTVTLKLAALTPAVLDAAERQITTETWRLTNLIKEHFSDNGLQVRSGALRRSVQQGPTERGPAGVVGFVFGGQGLPYARIQEYGGTIFPVHAQYLAIPLDAAKTAAGVARFGPRDAGQAGYDTFIRNNIIFGKRDNEITPLFVLKSSVTIPARPWFYPQPEAEKSSIAQSLQAAILSAMQEA